MKKIGKYGEEIAAGYLQREGYIIKERNYRSSLGEIDIICEHQGIIIFIEVKTRSSEKFGYAGESVDKNKQKRIMINALNYLIRKNLKTSKLRFDVILISLSDKDTIDQINHIKDAFNWELKKDYFNC